MSLEPINPQPPKKRSPRKRRVIERICVSLDEFVEATGISKPTVYRWMADGRIRYTQFGQRMRKIPTTEFARLGLSGETTTTT
jgi:excisionase family DNA binding protein